MKHLLLLLLLAAPLAAAEDFQFTSFDGTILDARIVTPEGDGPWPAVMVPHGWGGSFDDSTAKHLQQILTDEGFLVLSWTARGFGNSEGESSLNGEAEQKDMKALVDLLASDERVLMENGTDPVLGAMGRSYAGAIMQLTARDDPRFDALVPITTWYNLADSLAPAQIAKTGWLSLLYASGMQSTHGLGTEPNAVNEGGLMAEIHEWYAYVMATHNVPPAAYTALAGERSMHKGEHNTPTFFIQGWPDTLFTPGDAIKPFQDMVEANVTARLMLYPGGHGGFYANDLGDWELPWQLEMEAEAIDFLKTHLLDNQSRIQYPVLRYDYQSESYIPELQWPPAGTQMQRYFMGEGTLSDTPPSENITTTLVLGQAQSCNDVPNFQQDVDACPYTVPRGSQTWIAPPFTEDTEVTGQPEVHIEFGTLNQFGARLFFTLMDVAPDGSETPVLRQTVPYQEPFPGDIQVTLETITHTFPAGHSAGIQIAAGNAFMAATREPGTVNLVSYAEKPGLVYLPIIQQGMSGDQETPTATITVMDCDNCTDVPLELRVSDDWQVGAELSVNAHDANVTWVGEPNNQQALLTLNFTTEEQFVLLHATDPSGKNATATFTLPALVQQQAVESTSDPESPGFGVLAGLLAIALLLRRK